MANNFKPWVDTPTPGQQVQSASDFEDDEQRINGFKAGDPASALRVNSALRQANLVAAGLMEFCNEVNSLPDDLSLLSTVTQVKNAIKDSIETLHNTTLTSAKDYTDENIGELEADLQALQNEVDGKQDALTFDDAPTDESDNPVKSRGIKSYVDMNIASLERGILYDQVVRTQAEFEEMIGSEDWLGATSVALVGQFVYDEPNNKGIKIPATVKQIHGFNSAKITITNFKYAWPMAKGGLWYDTRPTTLDYSIRDLEVSCDGIDAVGFYNCTNLMNCTGTATGGMSKGYGFSFCTNLTNCTGTGEGTKGYGFNSCTSLTNCTGTGTGLGTATGQGYGHGFNDCVNLMNCIGKGSGRYGWGFYSIVYASHCQDAGSSTNMWGGINENINVETCRKTLVEADNSELNT